jgi:hypothetical protein
MSFHSLSGGLHIFSSIYKLVTELFNHRQEGYNMLLRLQVFIHWEEHFFHPSTSWLQNFSTTDKRVTTCSWRYDFSSIERRVTQFFHLSASWLCDFSSTEKEGYGVTLKPQCTLCGRVTALTLCITCYMILPKKSAKMRIIELFILERQQPHIWSECRND